MSSMIVNYLYSIIPYQKVNTLPEVFLNYLYFLYLYNVDCLCIIFNYINELLVLHMNISLTNINTTQFSILLTNVFNTSIIYIKNSFTSIINISTILFKNVDNFFILKFNTSLTSIVNTTNIYMGILFKFTSDFFLSQYNIYITTFKTYFNNYDTKLTNYETYFNTSFNQITSIKQYNIFYILVFILYITFFLIFLVSNIKQDIPKNKILVAVLFNKITSCKISDIKKDISISYKKKKITEEDTEEDISTEEMEEDPEEDIPTEDPEEDIPTEEMEEDIPTEEMEEDKYSKFIKILLNKFPYNK